MRTTRTTTRSNGDFEADIAEIAALSADFGDVQQPDPLDELPRIASAIEAIEAIQFRVGDVSNFATRRQLATARDRLLRRGIEIAGRLAPRMN